MGQKVDAEIKKRMRDAGIWFGPGGFRQYQDAQKAAGVAPKTARAQALERYTPILEQVEAGEVRAEVALAEFTGSPEGASPKPESPEVDRAAGRAAVTPDTWSGRDRATTGPTLDDIRWVYDHLAYPPAQLDPATAPGPGAWELYRWARGSAQARSEFYRQILPKVLPKQAEADEGEEAIIRGDHVLTLIEDVRKQRQAAEKAVAVGGR